MWLTIRADYSTLFQTIPNCHPKK